MRIIRNFLALVGLLAIVIVAYAGFHFKDKLQGFDPGAVAVYQNMMTKLLESKNSAEAMVVKIPVEEGISAEDVEDAMLAVATEHNIANVGILPLSKDIEAKTGKPYRLIKIFLFCRSRTAGIMMDYSDAYAAFMPCRVTLIEDQQGKYWLHTMDMDAMIHGGAPLPPDVLKHALAVKDSIMEIMHRGAKGEF